jgi:hypothetical protein
MTQTLTSYYSEASFTAPILHLRGQQADGYLVSVDLVIRLATVAAALAFITIVILVVVSINNSVTIGSAHRVPTAPLGHAANSLSGQYRISTHGADVGSVDAADDLAFDVKWARSIDQITRFAFRPPVPANAIVISESRIDQQSDQHKSMLWLGANVRTAVYDIAAHTVYLPNGSRLEAHSGRGNRLDDPRYVAVRDKGPTPPHVYDLAMREQVFHGVMAIRLRPVGSGNMFGRDGMLAHPYLTSANGQSNGCVAFKDYSSFLKAYLNGEIDRLLVVPYLGHTSLRAANARRQLTQQYADNNP